MGLLSEVLVAADVKRDSPQLGIQRGVVTLAMPHTAFKVLLNDANSDGSVGFFPGQTTLT
jgi:hypothetical protein